MRDVVVVIPALNPGDGLIVIINELIKAGLDKIIIVDDGSDNDHRSVFIEAEAMGVSLISHECNCGKGEALKSGFNAALEIYNKDIGLITADSDGQHNVSDILKIRDMLLENPNKLILGVRDFSKKDIPWRSKFGNTVTTKVFKLINGVTCPDTQTGLRGIPSSLIELAINTDGSRYEYEMNFLSEATKYTEFLYVPIETIYEDGNSVSHFRPIRDSVRVYGRFFRFLVSSLSGFVVDYLLFILLIITLPRSGFDSSSQCIIIATVTARIVSGIVNFLMNKYFFQFLHKIYYYIIPINLFCHSKPEQ